MLVDEVFMAGLLAEAAGSGRRRVNYDLRTSEADTSQRMLNALMPDTCVPIHRHSASSETVICLKGRVTEIFYDGDGAELSRHCLWADGGARMLQIPQGQWHRLVAHEPSVIFEAKDGAYAPLPAEDVLR